MATSPGSASHRSGTMEIIQTEGVAKSGAAEVPSITTYSSPLAIWRNEHYFNPTPVLLPPENGLTVSLQTPSGPIFIPYHSFAGPFPPVQQALRKPHAAPLSNGPYSSDSPFPAYFPLAFVELLQTAGFHNTEDVKSSTGDLDLPFVWLSAWPSRGQMLFQTLQPSSHSLRTYASFFKSSRTIHSRVVTGLYRHQTEMYLCKPDSMPDAIQS